MNRASFLWLGFQRQIRQSAHVCAKVRWLCSSQLLFMAGCAESAFSIWFEPWSESNRMESEEIDACNTFATRGQAKKMLPGALLKEGSRPWPWFFHIFPWSGFKDLAWHKLTSWPMSELLQCCLKSRKARSKNPQELLSPQWALDLASYPGLNLRLSFSFTTESIGRTSKATIVIILRCKTSHIPVTWCGWPAHIVELCWIHLIHLTTIFVWMSMSWDLFGFVWFCFRMSTKFVQGPSMLRGGAGHEDTAGCSRVREFRAKPHRIARNMT